MHGCSWDEVVFLTCTVLTRQHAACASESVSITLAEPVSPRNLNAACVCVKVESITILTESPALNWPCTAFASRRYNAIRCHGRDWRWKHACTHGSCRLPCVRVYVVRALGVGGVGTHAAHHWVQLTAECGGLWLAKYKQIACQSPGWSRLNKYSKISNSCVSFESNRIASNYSIRNFEYSHSTIIFRRNRYLSSQMWVSEKVDFGWIKTPVLFFSLRGPKVCHLFVDKWFTVHLSTTYDICIMKIMIAWSVIVQNKYSFHKLCCKQQLMVWHQVSQVNHISALILTLNNTVSVSPTSIIICPLQAVKNFILTCFWKVWFSDKYHKNSPRTSKEDKLQTHSTYWH